MRVALILLLHASVVVAQNRPAIPPAPVACGPAQVKFDVKLDQTQHSLAQPEPGKALVYVFEEFQQQRGFITPTIRVGLDGGWVGANRGSSYIFLPIDPGEHHLCVNW